MSIEAKLSATVSAARSDTACLLVVRCLEQIEDTRL